MPELIQQVKDIFQSKSPFQKVAPADVMRAKEKELRYALNEAGEIIGLNFYKSGLTTEKWKKICRDLPGLSQSLQFLNLAENQLTEIEFSADFKNLRELNLAENKSLARLTFSAPLPLLERLDASECQISEFKLPDGFSNLKWLDLRKTGLKTLQLTACPALELLDLSGNGLEKFELPEGFGGLKYLYLNNNQLKNLDFEAAPRQLALLNLQKNQLADLPENLLSFTSLQTLYLHGNAFKGNIVSAIPKDEKDNAYKTIADYLLALQGGKVPNTRVKIIIVGNGRVGKTSMFKRLKGLKFNPKEPLTHGISLGQLNKKDLHDYSKTKKLHANVWDFGGQEIFYATHQFFLSDDAIYILAWTAEENVLQHRERDKNLLPSEERWRENEYWLENIRHHSKESPLLMVQTHCDKKRSNPKAAFAEQPFAAEFLDFCAADEIGGGLKLLKRSIAERLNTQIKRLGDDIPVSYDKVIGEIENRKKENRITRAQFDEICTAAKVPADGINSLLKFLHDIGTIVWYEDIPSLADTIFINPNWLATQVYRLINKDLEKTGGRMSRAWVEQELSRFSKEEIDQLLDLLSRFKLIFEVNGEFIAPQYLPATLDRDAQTSYDKTKRRLQPAFQFRFPKFVPDNVMVNFLSTYGPFSDKIPFKNGISFTWQAQHSPNEMDCIVEFDEANRTLSVFAPANSSDCHALQFEICRAFVELSRNANAEIALEGKPFVSWQKLMEEFEAKNANVRAVDGKTILPVGDFVRFLEKEKGIEKEPDEPKSAEQPKPQNATIEINMATTTSTKPKRPKVFVSYAHKEDSRYMELFVEGIRDFSDWEIFDDRQILIGQDWHERLTHEVADCDFGIMLLSPLFFKSAYIEKHEFGQFVKRNAEKGFPFFSVLLSGNKFEQWEEIAKRQIFVAHGQNYNLGDTHRDKQIPFDKLVSFSTKNEVIPNPYRRDFCENFVEAVNKALKAKQKP